MKLVFLTGQASIRTRSRVVDMAECFVFVLPHWPTAQCSWRGCTLRLEGLCFQSFVLVLTRNAVTCRSGMSAALQAEEHCWASGSNQCHRRAWVVGTSVWCWMRVGRTSRARGGTAATARMWLAHGTSLGCRTLVHRTCNVSGQVVTQPVRLVVVHCVRGGVCVSARV